MIESLVAIVAYVSIAIHFHTYVWIPVGACVAPFPLLRTDISTACGIAAFDAFLDWWYDKVLKGILRNKLPDVFEASVGSPTE